MEQPETGVGHTAACMEVAEFGFPRERPYRSVPSRRSHEIDFFEAIAERLQWWAELFEPPCIGFAESREEAGEFVAAGADFVLVGDFIWVDPRGPAAALSEVERTMQQAFAQSSGKVTAGQE